MTWSKVFSDFIQPILFAGLFAMTFVSMLVALRNERRERKKRERRIVPHDDVIDPVPHSADRRTGAIRHPHARKSAHWFSVYG